MGIELIFISAALVSVLLTRGSYRSLFTTKFNHWWTLVAALGAQLVITFAHIPRSQYDSTGLAILLFTYVMLFGFCSANINLRGMWIVLLGIVSNAVAIGLNSGMPVTTSNGFTVKETIKHQAATSTDIAPWLTDVIPINPLSIALSVGDILFGLGILYVCIAASRKPKVQEEDLEAIAEIVDEKDISIPLTAKEMIEELEESILIDLTSSPSHLVAPAEEVPMPVMRRSRLKPVAPKRAEAIAEREARVMPYADREPVYVEPAQPEPAASEAPARTGLVQPRKPARAQAPSIPMTPETEPEMKTETHAVVQQEVRTERAHSRRKNRKWQRSHGLAALPSKEELGFDDTSMEVVDAAG